MLVLTSWMSKESEANESSLRSVFTLILFHSFANLSVLLLG